MLRREGEGNIGGNLWTRKANNRLEWKNLEKAFARTRLKIPIILNNRYFFEIRDFIIFLTITIALLNE